MTSNKYRSLEHIIANMLVEGLYDNQARITNPAKYRGNAPGFMNDRNSALQATARPAGDFEGGVSLPKQKMSIPIASKGKPDPKDVCKAPNQGDATTSADLSARGAAQEGGKKKLREDNLDLIKKGSLNKGPLTQYTNPQNDNTQSPTGAPKPVLSFQTPNLSDDKEDEIQTPKLGDKKTGKNSGKVPTPKTDPKLAQAEKITNQVLKTNPQTTAVGPNFSTPSFSSAPAAAPTSAPPAAPLAGSGAKVAAPTGGASQKDPNGSNAPGAGIDLNKFNNQQQATPPVSPGGGMAGNTPKGTSSPTLENPSKPSQGSSPVDVVGKGPGETAQVKSAADGSKGGPQHVPMGIDTKNLPLSRATATMAALRNPPMPVTPMAATMASSDETPQPTNRGTRTGNNPENDPESIHRDKGAEGPNAGQDRKGRIAAQEPVPQEKPVQKKPPEYETWTPEQKKKYDDLETLDIDPTKDLQVATDIAQLFFGTPWQRLRIMGKYGNRLNDLIKAGKEHPPVKPGEKSPVENKPPETKTPEEKPPEKKPSEKVPEEKKPTEEKPPETEKPPGAGRWWKRGAAAGAGAGLGAAAIKYGTELALLKYLLGLGKYEHGSKGKGGQFQYGDQGQITGLPTRMKEEVENLDKVRRAVELVGRRNGTNKKKSSLGRQSAIKTRIIDEDHLKIMREAIKEKMDKDKKLKPGEHKTPVDLHPKINPLPTDNLATK